jgi:hypothetical protein
MPFVCLCLAQTPTRLVAVACNDVLNVNGPAGFNGGEMMQRVGFGQGGFEPHKVVFELFGYEVFRGQRVVGDRIAVLPLFEGRRGRQN